MIDITHPFHKTLWFMEQYTKGSNFSFLEGNEQGKTCLDFLEEILNFEVKKEKYKNLFYSIIHLTIFFILSIATLNILLKH